MEKFHHWHRLWKEQCWCSNMEENTTPYALNGLISTVISCLSGNPWYYCMESPTPEVLVVLRLRPKWRLGPHSDLLCLPLNWLSSSDRPALWLYIGDSMLVTSGC